MDYSLPFRILVIFVFVAFHSVALGQSLESGPQVLTFFSEVDDTDQPYALYLPDDFDASKAYPLVVSLHGAGSNHRLNLRRVFGESNKPGENDVEATRYFPEWDDVDYIVASPYARGTMGYQGVAEKDVYDVLTDVKERFPIDEDRVYLTGLSMGGGGTLWLGLTRPDLWAAIAPVCPAPPEGTVDLAGNALHVPVHFFQGGADPVVNPEGTRTWVQRLEDLGTRVEYDEYPGIGHNSWENAYADASIFDWFGQFERIPHPDRVRFSTPRYQYNSAYWVRLDRLTPGTLAEIDARFTAPNRIEVTTSDVDAFTLSVKEHPKYAPHQAVEVTVNGEAIRVEAGHGLSFSKRGGAWTAQAYRAETHVKRPGLEGPMPAALADRHIYVYGTADDPSDEERQARQAQALKAAEWSVYRGPFWGRIMVFPRVVADENVRESDLATSHLVLFGTEETNSLIGRFSDQLPMHLDEGARDHGLVYVYPRGQHYVLVNAGLPWWTTGDEPSFSFGGNVPAFQLPDSLDYLLFEETTSNVVASGRFDTHWRMPEDDRAAMTATGVVTVSASE